MRELQSFKGYNVTTLHGYKVKMVSLSNVSLLATGSNLHFELFAFLE